jgi:SAM-dependent methyltransferase
MSTCSACNSSRTHAAFSIGSYELARCDDCSHLFVSSGVDAAALARAYDQSYYDDRAVGANRGYENYLRNADLRMRGFKERLQQIERRVARRGRLLDYGCAVGLFVKVAADAGWQATGYERSEWAASYGRETFGLDIVIGDGSAPPPFDDRFDVITMWDVLEHLEDPRHVLDSVSRWLKPSGVLALNTVNASSLGARRADRAWRHLAPPHHLQYFSNLSLQRLLADFGFRIVWKEARGVMLEASGAPSAGGALNAIEQLATHWRTRRLATALNLLDEIEILAIRDRAP